MEALRVRASSLLSSAPFRARASSHASSPNAGSPGSPQSFDPSSPTLHENASSANGGSGRIGTIQENGEGTEDNSEVAQAPARRPVRVLPSWVHSANDENDDEDDDNEDAEASSNLLPKSPTQPSEAQIAQHNHTPTFTFKSKPEPGRLYDAQRISEPPLPRRHVSEMGSRWRQFAQWSAYPVDREEPGELVTEDWLVEHGPDYSVPWHGADEEKGLPPKMWMRWERFQRTLLRNPVVPLIFRFVVLIFSATALGLAISMFRSHPTDASITSPVMAIAVDTLAIVYLLLIAWDEYSGQPLGLRSVKTKLRLVLLDLFFIVFDSANLSIAFEALGPPYEIGKSFMMKQQALASVLLVALVAWLTTFVISIFRVVEKVER